MTAREKRMAAGLQDLQTFLRDGARLGFPNLPKSAWEAAAQRLVDAQCGALATEIRLYLAAPEASEEITLALAARLHLRAKAGLTPGLPPLLHAELQRLLGVNLKQSELPADDATPDTWTLLAQRRGKQEKLTVRTTWLYGSESQRWAQVLEYAHPMGDALDPSFVPGRAVRAEARWYPSPTPLRVALFGSQAAVPAPWPAGLQIREMLESFSQILARNPLVEGWPFALGPVRLGRKGEGWWVVEESGDGLPLAAEGVDLLLAVGGGGPMTVVGEWSGERLEVWACRPA